MKVDLGIGFAVEDRRGAIVAFGRPMFMSRYTETWGAVDGIAGGIRGLGYPPRDYSAFARRSSIAEESETPKAMAVSLVRGHEAGAPTARRVFKIADKIGDRPTADLATQGLQVREKTGWMLRGALAVD